MNAGELYEWLGAHTAPDMEVILEVGGDGAVHTDFLKSCKASLETDRAILSAED